MVPWSLHPPLVHNSPIRHGPMVLTMVDTDPVHPPWMVDMEKNNLKWMKHGANAHFRKPPYIHTYIYTYTYIYIYMYIYICIYVYMYSIFIYIYSLIPYTETWKPPFHWKPHRAPRNWIHGHSNHSPTRCRAYRSRYVAFIAGWWDFHHG